jgi:cell wall-associated NlpC family hydrolase
MMDGRELALLARTSLVLAALTAALPASADARYAKRTLRLRSHGGDVKLFQRYLTKAGFRTAADGYYGRHTQRSERRFERSAHRHVDGRASLPDQRMVKRAARRRAARTRTGKDNGTGGTGYSAAEGNPSGQAVLSADRRTAIAPDSAPAEVRDAVKAANRITRKPYRYGGGHGRWEDSGYDCSGSVSYAMHGAGLLKRPLDSTGFESWGATGPGRWITVYANSGHAYTVIAGLRFDTSGAGAGGGSGPRWRTKRRSARGYVGRHPAGL